jgi:biopolymer transport protein ExbB/TolQ
MQGSLNQYLIRISIFMILILIVVVFLYPALQASFISNIYINTLIVAALIFGLIFNVYNLSKLNFDYNVLKKFNIHNSPQVFLSSSSSLKNIMQQMHEKNGQFSFKSSVIEKILETTDMSLINLRETSRYLVGLLVFLGLLGTFWGLLKTIGSVGNVIGGLGLDDTNVADFFNNLKDGLNAPLQGMSIAFSSSLLGLAGSLILGFADLNLGQAQNKFLQFLEKTLHNNSSPDFINTPSSDSSTLLAIQKIYDNLDSLIFVLKESSQNQSQIFSYMKSLSEQMKELNNNSREQDKKLSNFLSTQLNTQTSMLQLTDQLNKEGLIDLQTKKYLENIDKGIQQLLSKSNK